MFWFFIFSGNCAEFLINAQCVSSQFQMLQILCSFVEDATEPLEQLWPLFETKLNRHTFNALKSVKWCTGVGVPLARQLYMLEHINQMRTATHKDRWIFSESIESIKFDDRVAIACEVSVYSSSLATSKLCSIQGDCFMKNNQNCRVLLPKMQRMVSIKSISDSNLLNSLSKCHDLVSALACTDTSKSSENDMIRFQTKFWIAEKVRGLWTFEQATPSDTAIFL